MVQERLGSLGIINFCALYWCSFYVDNQKDFTVKKKVILSIVFTLWFIIVIGMGNSNSETPKANASNPSSSVSESNKGNLRMRTRKIQVMHQALLKKKICQIFRLQMI